MSSFTELCCLLKAKDMKKIYLIHEPQRTSETREFAEKLRQKGFEPIIADDFRRFGKKAVSAAIASSDLSLVVVFDDELMRKVQNLGVQIFHVIEERTP